MKKLTNKPLPEQNLPNFLKETRKKLGLSAEEIAKLLETTSRSYRRWENGENDPSGQAIAKLHYLREQNIELFNPDQPVITVNNLAEQQSSFLEQLSTLLNVFKQQENFIEKQH